MDYHQNARLTVHSREQLAERVLEQGLTDEKCALVAPYLALHVTPADE